MPPYSLLTGPYGSWSKVVHYVGNKVHFGMHPQYVLLLRGQRSEACWDASSICPAPQRSEVRGLLGCILNLSCSTEVRGQGPVGMHPQSVLLHRGQRSEACWDASSICPAPQRSEVRGLLGWIFNLSCSTEVSGLYPQYVLLHRGQRSEACWDASSICPAPQRSEVWGLLGWIFNLSCSTEVRGLLGCILSLSCSSEVRGLLGCILSLSCSTEVRGLLGCILSLSCSSEVSGLYPQYVLLHRGQRSGACWDPFQ
ncbi:uncharacterized protein LOC127919826 isoform X1 [Oncorhynchus keta]|uniref:uncharacterized protein LOC127919826 isoform X1 n=1 Tax=Oncorhynchus keta TaxID=8018 RepID=UPI00227AE0AE|nr:uncharacterized protein LOC127919826 isoform X1 [Oncorhynchus keta]